MFESCINCKIDLDKYKNLKWKHGYCKICKSIYLKTKINSKYLEEMDKCGFHISYEELIDYDENNWNLNNLVPLPIKLFVDGALNV